MLTTIKDKKLTWIDLESPTLEEVASIAKRFSIHPLVTEELLQPSLRPKVDVYKNALYLILHFPVFDPVQRTSISREIDFVIGKNFLITVHYEVIDPLYELTKICSVGNELRDKYSGKHAGFLLFHILHQLYDFSLRELGHIQVKIDHIEKQIFQGNERQAFREISLVRRDIINFRRSIRLHEAILKSFLIAGEQFFGADFSPYLNNIIGEYFRVWNWLESTKETAEALQTTNESLLSTKTNEIIKVLTIMAFITFPLTLIGTIFGMNTDYLPIVGLKGDFWIILGIMITGMIIMLVFFKRKRWL